MHLLKPKYKVKMSQIANSGKGLFVLQKIPKNRYIFQYIGKIRRTSKVDFKNMCCVKLSRQCVLDGWNKENIGRFINDAEGLQTSISCKTNVCLVRWKGKVFIQAIRDIRKNEELFLSYGEYYWKIVSRG